MSANGEGLHDDGEAVSANGEGLHDDREVVSANGERLHDDREAVSANGERLHDDSEAVSANGEAVSGIPQISQRLQFATIQAHSLVFNTSTNLFSKNLRSASFFTKGSASR